MKTVNTQAKQKQSAYKTIEINASIYNLLEVHSQDIGLSISEYLELLLNSTIIDTPKGSAIIKLIDDLKSAYKDAALNVTIHKNETIHKTYSFSRASLAIRNGTGMTPIT